ncbi:MAG: hypothetical protein AM326_07415 [Candidatus Thorarchaeota archaeon SMTZ-45]|nr:MAG: hypothetical protein AM326_07415 [Candidatus Thorarchaeota archaeon SMTZ-45]
MKRVKVVTIALAFTFILLAFAAQPVAAASRLDSLTSYLNSRYDAVRGGYSIPGEGVVRIDPTYGAISIMNELGSIRNRPPPVTITLVMDFLIDRQWLSGNEGDEPRYGGFGDYLLGPVTNGGNYRGLAIWQILKDQSDIPGTEDYDINATANLFWINRTYTDSGGFALNTEAIDAHAGPDLLSTAYALSSIRLIHTMYSEENAWDWLVNETATVEWIESCKEGNGYKLSPNDFLPSVTGTAAAVMAYHALDPLAAVPDASILRNWLVERQVLDSEEADFNGGFEEGNGTEVSSLESTYYALSAIEILNGLQLVNTTAVEEFILNCQTSEGSFANTPGTDTGKLLYSGYACEILNMAGSDRALNILSSFFITITRN